MRVFAIGCALSFACVSVACGGERAQPGPAPAFGSDRTRVGSTRGAAVVVSADAEVAVATNRGAGSITVFHLVPGAPAAELVEASFELPVGLAAEPWAAVIGRDDDTAFVVLRGGEHETTRGGSVVRVRGLHGHPRIDGSMDVGSEPTGVAITPSGAQIYVANWGEGTVSLIRPDRFGQAFEKINLNRTLAATGWLGEIGGAWEALPAEQFRPGLAHPRALAMSDDGDEDDSDETLFVTEFFSQPLPGVTPTPDHAELDRNRQGVIYTISMADGSVGETITLPPVEDTGFFDSNEIQKPEGERRATACFPNQLYAAAMVGQRLIVSSVCASPRGPVGSATVTTEGQPSVTLSENFKTLVHPVLFQLETVNRYELMDHAVLDHWLEGLYASDGTTGADARMPLIPNDVALEQRSDGGLTAFVSALGADAVFGVEIDASGAFSNVGVPGQRFIDLRGGPAAGRLPIGVALAGRAGETGGPLLVLNDNTQNLSVVERATQSVVGFHETAVCTDGLSTPCSGKVRLDSDANRGHRLFATGLTTWSFQGQAWSSCESCHPDGLSDGVTWSFARGPRRTISTAGTYPNPDSDRRRMLLWTANVDEVHDVEAIARGVSGGVGGLLWKYPGDSQTNDCRLYYDGSELPAGTGTEPCRAPKRTTALRSGLNGSLAELLTGRTCPDGETCDETANSDWNDIDAYVRSVRAPKRPTTLDATFVDVGRQLFLTGGCATCHAGPGFTISNVFYTPGLAANGALPYQRPEELPSLGDLRDQRYSLPAGMPVALHPPAANEPARFRSLSPANPNDTATELDMAYAGLDQINCVLRDVGTFPGQAGTAPNTTAVTPPGVAPIAEVKHDMSSLGLGADGFNIPSLLGLAAGGPYFHAGNARTLEEVFDPVFDAHTRAISSTFLQRSADIPYLVSFLLSVDDRTTALSVDTANFDPDLCGQFEP